MGSNLGSKNSFDDFSLFKLLTGTPIYKFDIFYDIKNTLVRYDERTDYINYGYWREGEATTNPSAELVKYVIAKLDPTEDDVLLNAGSGMGQPDVDIVDKFRIRKIVGVNILSEQVEYANEKFKLLGIDDVVEHRVLDIGEIRGALKDDGITRVFSIEGMCEFPDAKKFIEDCYALLPPGGIITFSDYMRIRSPEIGMFKRMSGNIFRAFTRLIYGDNWGEVDIYRRYLENSGFKNVVADSIGERVFAPVAQHARERYPLLKQKGIPTYLRLFSLWSVLSVYLLYKWKQIDYQVFSAEKPNNDA